MPLIILIRHTGCMSTNRNLFRQTVLQKNARESTIVLWIIAMFEEYQQPAIETTILPTQSFDHGLDTVFRNPNKNSRWPTTLRKTQNPRNR